ncbi:MAG: molybdenum ABC transporter ATP-binding protein [bacterium]
MLTIHVRKKIADFCLELDLEIQPAFTALFGPSGAGKTTTLNLISGLSSPSEGKISLGKTTLFSGPEKINLPPRKRNIGYIFQESRLFPHLTVKNNLIYGLTRTPDRSRRFDFDEIVEIVGVSHVLDRDCRDLSGGEKQRVALGRALLASPQYLLMDEPLSALDLNARLSFLSFLKDIHQRYALPILYVTHDLATVFNFAEQVVIIEHGKNVGAGPIDSQLEKMKTTPLLPGEDIPNIFRMTILAHEPSKGLTFVRAGELTFTLPLLQMAAGEEIMLNIPAAEIILSTEKPRNLSASNILPGFVHKLRHLGERILVEVDAGLKFTVEIVPATVERLALQKGKKVFLIMKASSFRKLSPAIAPTLGI